MVFQLLFRKIKIKKQGPEARAHVPGHRHAQCLSPRGALHGALLSGAHPDLTRHGGGHRDTGIVMFFFLRMLASRNGGCMVI